MNSLFASAEFGMDLPHPSFARLLGFAKEVTAAEPYPIRTELDLRNRMKESSQTFNNWKGERGVSKNGALKAQREFGCSPSWVLHGIGEPTHLEGAPPPSGAPADDVIQALRILAGIENRAKRMSIAQMVAMVAADPSDLENVAEMLRDLLPQPQLARASQRIEPTGLIFQGLGSRGLNPNVRGDSVPVQGTQRRKDR